MGGEMPENGIEAQVLEEIKKFGDDISGIKKNHEELNKNYKNLIDSYEKDKPDLTKIEKLKTDIVTRQDALDKKHVDFSKRIEDIEVAMKRPSGVSLNINEKAFKEAVDHFMNCKSLKGSEGINWKQMKEFKPNMEEFEQYKKAFENYLRTEEKLIEPADFKTLSVGVDPHGGYTVTPFMASQILTKIFEMDPIRQLAQTMSISTDAVEWLVDRDESGAGWEGETENSAETGTPDFGKKKIAVHQMYAKPTATQQLLEDSAIPIESWLANKIAERFARLEGVSFVLGDGIGKPRGFLTYPNGTNWGQIEQINSGAAANVTADGFVNLKYAMREEFLNTGTYVMNRLTLRDTMLLKNGIGDYIWKPGMIATDPASTILGLPVRMSASMPVVAANALSVALGDFREAYMIVDRLGITVQRDPYTKKPYVEFYTRKRVGGDVINYDAIKIMVIHV